LKRQLLTDFNRLYKQVEPRGKTIRFYKSSAPDVLLGIIEKSKSK